MRLPLLLLGSLLVAIVSPVPAAEPFDAAPFALPLPDGEGLLWEDPREVHKVVVHFADSLPPDAGIRLEYWGSRWPQQHLPKDREPGGGDVGWMELGNWHQGGWRKADTEHTIQGKRITFTFRPVNQQEFPAVKDYPAQFRYTLKLRLSSDAALPPIKKIEAFTDSALSERQVLISLAEARKPDLTVFNGQLLSFEKASRTEYVFRALAVANPDPNTFDRTLVTVELGKKRFTFSFDQLAEGPLYLPDFGAAIFRPEDSGFFATLAEAHAAGSSKTLYQRVSELPEQSWQSAWQGLPPKKSRIYFPLGLDGGRQRFQLNADGSIEFRSNDHYLRDRPGKDTPRLDLEPGPVALDFAIGRDADERFIEEQSLPVCVSLWREGDVQITQTAFVTPLPGTKPAQGPPEPDACGVFMAQFVFTNTGSASHTATLPIRYRPGRSAAKLETDEAGFLRLGDRIRAQVLTSPSPSSRDGLTLRWELAPGEAASVTLKVPYVVLDTPAEATALRALDFAAERNAVAGYWRKRLNESARLITPEPVLNQFYRSHARHLLVNCEAEPGASRRFARVGSFSYGAYGNESCMMVEDLERRGYHDEARQCLDAWLQYQGTVKLPGDFQSQDGILYGAGGYEAGGYNQHHGWILWSLAQHYKFTRDERWLRSAVPGILRAADWIITETRRTADRHPLERGLLPAGSLEDIGDWWTWLSTSCYTWRGLDAAAWALEQIRHPEAIRIRREADRYHHNLVANFSAASERAPVVRLRDGTAVPHFPSHVHRRGRSFGWICETLEGAIHLLIAGVLDPRSPQALWILNDYEDNLYLSNQYGYTLDDFEQHWFSRGGMSMQACLLLGVEPYLYRDDVSHALRAVFNSIAVSHFPDVHLNTEHALPEMGDWRGDHFKSSDEANACGWLRYLFVRESGDTLLVGQAVPRAWLAPGQRCGIDQTATHFGKVSVLYSGEEDRITARLQGPTRNPPKQIRLRLRVPDARALDQITVNGKPWKLSAPDWVELPGDIGQVEVIARLKP